MALWKGTRLPSEGQEGRDGWRRSGAGRQLMGARRSHGFWEGIHNPFGSTGLRAETCRLQHQPPHRNAGEARNGAFKCTTPAPGVPVETPQPPSLLERDPLLAEGVTWGRGSAPHWESSMPWCGLRIPLARRRECWQLLEGAQEESAIPTQGEPDPRAFREKAGSLRAWSSGKALYWGRGGTTAP